MNNKLLSGAFWLSVGNIFSRILGIIYLIPWIIMIGQHHVSAAQALFNSAYTPYALFISLGTAGFPSAIARRVASYNNNHQYEQSNILLKSGIILMSLSGLFCAIILFLIAPIIAKNSPVASTHEATRAIRMVTPALLLIPTMSAMRGWFQGNQDLKPFGLSQIIEQFIRIVFILVSTYVVIYLLKSNFNIAVQSSVFAAFVGALSGLLYLFWYFYRNYSDGFTYKITNSELSQTLTLIKVTFYESIPFLLVGSGITISQLIDQVFFKQILHSILGMSVIRTQYIYTLFSANPNKITTVVTALAMAISETSLPLLSAVRNDQQSVVSLISKNFQYMLIFLLPIVTLLITLAYEINFVFYSKSTLGGIYLQTNLIQSLIMAISIDLLTILQALRYSKKAMLYISIGLLIKLILQFPLVYFWQGQGAILATDIAFACVILLSYQKLSSLFDIKMKTHYPIILLNIGYLLLTTISYHFSFVLFPATTKAMAFLFSAVFSAVLLLIYILVLDLTNMSYNSFGRYFIINKS